MPTGVYFHKKRLPFSEEWRKNMSNVQKGKKQSEEHKRKIGLSNKGRIVDENFLRRMSKLHGVFRM